jgi:hypothetical protein
MNARWLLLSLVACSTAPRRFALRDPVWVDNDKNHVPEPPDDYWSGLLADGADQMVFRPLADLPRFRLPEEAANANAIDEVANSAWFQNRIGFFDITPEQAALGQCGATPPTLDPEKGPWTVFAAKPNGAKPGFFVKAPDGTRYLLKFDGIRQAPRGTAADVIGSKIYWTAGYHTVCNTIVYFDQKILEIDPKATAENEYGEKNPITQADIEKALSKGFRLKDGRLRGSISKFVTGKPLGPFTYEGTRGDDPNDVIPHQDRRELRGSYVFAAWTNHFDAREQNSFDVWTKEGDREYIKHYIIDWGDIFGSRWPHDQISRRLGRSYYFDWEHVFVDLVTLGTLPRTWNQADRAEEEIYGYFDVDAFDPERYRPGYPNLAFDRRTARDVMWGVRILARFTPEHVAAMVKTGKFPDPRQEEFLVKRLLERQKKIIATFATKYAPLTNFKIARRTPGKNVQSLCFEDIATQHEVVDPNVVFYKLRFYGGEDLEDELGWINFKPDHEHPHRTCVVLPIGRRPSDLVKPETADDDPLRYGILKIYIHQTLSDLPTSEVDLHFYDLGPERGFRLVGVVRPDEASRPSQL